jgi:hypothetical protein
MVKSLLQVMLVMQLSLRLRAHEINQPISERFSNLLNTLLDAPPSSIHYNTLSIPWLVIPIHYFLS